MISCDIAPLTLKLLEKASEELGLTDIIRTRKFDILQHDIRTYISNDNMLFSIFTRYFIWIFEFFVHCHKTLYHILPRQNKVSDNVDESEVEMMISTVL